MPHRTECYALGDLSWLVPDPAKACMPGRGVGSAEADLQLDANRFGRSTSDCWQGPRSASWRASRASGIELTLIT